MVNARTCPSSGGCNIAGLATAGSSQRSAPPSKFASIKPHHRPATAISSVFGEKLLDQSHRPRAQRQPHAKLFQPPSRACQTAGLPG